MALAMGELNRSHQHHATDDITCRSQYLEFEKLTPAHLIGFSKECHEHFYGTYNAMVQSGNAYYKCHQKYHDYPAKSILC